MTFGCVIKHPLADANNFAVGSASPANPPISQPIPVGTMNIVGDFSISKTISFLYSNSIS